SLPRRRFGPEVLRVDRQGRVGGAVHRVLVTDPHEGRDAEGPAHAVPAGGGIALVDLELDLSGTDPALHGGALPVQACRRHPNGRPAGDPDARELARTIQDLAL